MTEWLLLLAAVLLTALTGFFVAAEFSLTTVDRGRAEQAAAAGDRGARGVVAALRTLSTQLSAAQLGITITTLVVGYLAERGEKALDRLRKNPQFQRTMEQLEAAAQNAQERVEHVRELADETLSKVAQRLRGAGEQAADR